MTAAFRVRVQSTTPIEYGCATRRYLPGLTILSSTAETRRQSANGHSFLLPRHPETHRQNLRVASPASWRGRIWWFLARATKRTSIWLALMTRPPRPRTVNAPQRCSHHSDDRFYCLAPTRLDRIESASDCRTAARKRLPLCASVATKCEIKQPIRLMLRILFTASFSYYFASKLRPLTGCPCLLIAQVKRQPFLWSMTLRINSFSPFFKSTFLPLTN